MYTVLLCELVSRYVTSFIGRIYVPTKYRIYGSHSQFNNKWNVFDSALPTSLDIVRKAGWCAQLNKATSRQSWGFISRICFSLFNKISRLHLKRNCCRCIIHTSLNACSAFSIFDDAPVITWKHSLVTVKYRESSLARTIIFHLWCNLPIIIYFYGY